MATDMQLTKARLVYGDICRALDEMGWSYDKSEDDFAVYTAVNGMQSAYVDLILAVDADNALVTLLSRLPFDVKKDISHNFSIAVSAINWQIPDGRFDFNRTKGTALYRISATYNGCILGDEAFKYLIRTAYTTVDRYSNKLAALNDESLSFDELIKWINNMQGDRNVN